MSDEPGGFDGDPSVDELLAGLAKYSWNTGLGSAAQIVFHHAAYASSAGRPWDVYANFLENAKGLVCFLARSCLFYFARYPNLAGRGFG